MFYGYTNYCKQSWVSFHNSPSFKDIGGHAIRWTKVLIDGRPIESFPFQHLKLILQELRNRKFTSLKTEMDADDDIKYILLFLQHSAANMRSACNDSIPCPKLEAEENDMRRSLLDNMSFHETTVPTIYPL